LRQSLIWVVGRRLVLSIPLLFIVSALSFVLLSLTPGNIAHEILGPLASQQQVAALTRALGLNDPIYEQYWLWLNNAVHGNLGVSALSGQPVSNLINERIGVTIALVAGSLLMTLVIGVPIGVIGALRGGWMDRVGDVSALVGYALPTLWVGALLIEFFAVKIRIFPAVGYTPPSQGIGHWLQSLVLPVAALSVGLIATLSKNTRDAMLDVLSSEHVRMARANGVPERSVICIYAMKIVGMRVLTILSLLMIGLLGGTILAEALFGLPGLGGALVSAVESHDVRVVQGIALVFTIMIVVINIVTDVLYRLLDPRVHAS
jgi:peptide/nickel transport system permease protein